MIESHDASAGTSGPARRVGRWGTLWIVTFAGVVVRMIRVHPVRSTVTAFGVAIGVAAVMALGVLTFSLRETATSIMQTGKADFTVAQFGASDILNGSVDETEVVEIAGTPGVETAVGAFLATADLDADHPFFLEIGLAPDEQSIFGVTITRGRSYSATAREEIMVGRRAARSFGVDVGDELQLEERTFSVVGVYTTGNAIGDAGAMFPVPLLQEWHRRPGLVTLVFVRTDPQTDIAALRERIELDHPQLTTMQTLTEFGRADRNLVLISAANTGGSLLALVIGATGVMNTALLSFYERLREFGLLRSVGWSRRRVFALVLCEAFTIAFVGAIIGVLSGFLAVRGLTQLPELVGVFRPTYDTPIFTRALSFAFGMALLGALYPALKAARLSPLDALRRET